MFTNTRVVPSWIWLLGVACLLVEGRVLVTADPIPCFNVNLTDFSDDYKYGPTTLNAAFQHLGYSTDIPQTCIDVPNGGDKKRCFFTYVPDSCRMVSPKKVPLVIDVHGWYGFPRQHYKYSGWLKRADEECMILVWPSGNPSDSGCRRSSWNIKGGALSVSGVEVTTAPCCCYEADGINPKDPGPDDPLFLKMIIDSVVEEFDESHVDLNQGISVDRNRIYMAGHSNGCMASLAMAALYSDTIAAVCCHAATVRTPFPDDYHAIPIFLALGEDDPNVPFDGNAAQGKFSVSQTIDYLSDKNECSEENMIVLQSTERVIVHQRTDCKHQANIQIAVVEDAGHYPFKMDPVLFRDQCTPGLNETSTPVQVLYSVDRWNAAAPTTIDTTEMAWNFCRAQKKKKTTKTTKGDKKKSKSKK